jgi:hypothetical protein
VPVAGLPALLRLTDIDFAIIAYNVNLSRVEDGFRGSFACAALNVATRQAAEIDRAA